MRTRLNMVKLLGIICSTKFSYLYKQDLRFLSCADRTS